jgi:hypothetical protein
MSACLLFSAAFAAVPASSADQAAGPFTSGVRCTIVGTDRNDILVGTAHRDVICGLGGNDRISGRGGNDVIGGGAGNDVIHSGSGNDRISGRGGNDIIDGGAGNDVIHSGSGKDRISGRGGDDIIASGVDNDVVDGGSGNDAVVGGAGKDSLTGSAGDDHLAGASGMDTISGEAGGDVQSGGKGDDLLRGAGGDDVITGAEGDDDLGGGPGADDVDGGAGFNVCDAPGEPDDHQVRCVVDTAPPVVGNLSATPATVDVSEAAQTVTLEAHVTDDTGVKSVQIGNAATLISGTTRDGIWATTIRVPRYLSPGPRDVEVFVGDRVGRWSDTTIADAYGVIDTDPDRQMPVLQSITLDKTAVDVRTAPQSITAKIHVTDDLAGPTNLTLCPAHSFPTGTPAFRQAGGCQSMKRASGDATDSTWQATYVVPKGAPSGTWNFEVWISDAAGNFDNDFWFGPDEIAAMGPTHEPRYHAILDGGGVFTVQGTAQDLDAPVLTSLTLSPSAVDTSTGAVQVTADIAGTDVQGITGADLSIAGYPGYPENPDYIDPLQVAWVQSFQRVSGTTRDGVWRATFVVPGGTPDGSYFIQATLEDSSHWESWVSPDSGWTSDNHLLTPDLAPGGTLFVVANS